MPGTRSSREATCPRCGYDLRGEVRRWRETCPVNGQCTECGLAFRWVEVLQRDRQSPNWWVEAQQARRFFLVRVVYTTGASCWPPFFWRRVQMRHRARWRGLIGHLFAMAMMVLILVHLSFGVIGFQRWQQYTSGQQVWIDYVDQNGRWTGIMPSYQVYSTSDDPIRALLLCIFTPTSAEPIAQLAAPRAPAVGRVPSDVMHHTVTLAPSGTTLVPPTVAGESPRTLIGGKWHLGSWPTSVFLKSPLPPRMELYARLTLIPLLIMLLCVPFFGFLPVSRRRAKVRWAHIWRIALYPIAWLALPVVYGAWSTTLGSSWQGGVPGSLGVITFTCIYLIPGALIVWWAYAVNRYLRMPHAWAVATLAVLFSYVVTLLLGHFTLIAHLVELA